MKISQLVFAYADAEPKIQILLYISPLKKKVHFFYFKFLAVSMFYMYNQKTDAKRLKEGSQHKFPEFFYVGHFPSNIPP